VVLESSCTLGIVAMCSNKPFVCTVNSCCVHSTKVVVCMVCLSRGNDIHVGRHDVVAFK
jgi:hypothetical protein